MNLRKNTIALALLFLLSWTDRLRRAPRGRLMTHCLRGRASAGSPKSAIVDFVEQVTDPSGSDFVPVPLRIAVFDMDGTILCERPVHFSMEIALHRLTEAATEQPELQELPLYQAVTQERPTLYSGTLPRRFVDRL